ncbi:MAG TPA: thioesterase family protein [Trebonia sp.]|nr:thioesterase family protein [Trebonia sp.]HUN32562.1 thioesterase family protein [Trebonia sp.]
MHGATETVEVFWEDLDPQGVLHNARYSILLEHALSAYWSRAGYPWDPAADHFRDMFFVVREFAITFHAPITRPGPVAVRFWFDHVGASSIVYGFGILSDDGSVTYASGRRVQVRLDPDTMRPARITSQFRELARPLMRQAVTEGHDVTDADALTT